MTPVEPTRSGAEDVARVETANARAAAVHVHDHRDTGQARVRRGWAAPKYTNDTRDHTIAGNAALDAFVSALRTIRIIAQLVDGRR
jgi:hypothetical protein